MRGRKPQNDAVKRMKGKVIGRINPPADRVLPSPPEHLSPEARVHWGWYSAQLDRMGVLSEEHAHGLEQLCCLYQEMVELRAEIKVSGPNLQTRTKAAP
jgi:phage terminase small subunit